MNVFDHLKIVYIKHDQDIINSINNEIIKNELNNPKRKLMGMLYEEDYGHMNRNQMLLNQHLAEIEEEEETNKL